MSSHGWSITDTSSNEEGEERKTIFNIFNIHLLKVDIYTIILGLKFTLKMFLVLQNLELSCYIEVSKGEKGHFLTLSTSR